MIRCYHCGIIRGSEYSKYPINSKCKCKTIKRWIPHRVEMNINAIIALEEGVQTND
jgi:hypothetical protein